MPAVARFLHLHMNRGIPVEVWQRMMLRTSMPERPNAGFLLEAGDDLVGVHVATYAQRVTDGRMERFCGLGPWCVLPGYEFDSMRLLMALLAQKGYHFIDLCPTDEVAKLDARLGFRPLDTRLSAVANLPWPSWPGRVRISSEPAEIEAMLTGDDLLHYRDHRDAPRARHVALRHGDRSCYVMLRRIRRRQVPVVGRLLHVSDPDLLSDLMRPFSRHLLFRHQLVALLVEAHLLRRLPRLSLALRRARPRMARTLRPVDVDYLYSELVGLPA